MSILSDIEIRNLCTRPTHMVHGQKSHPTDDYVKEFNSNDVSVSLHGSIRELTDEEAQDGFNPMISPFVGEQVRNVWRNPTEAEASYFWAGNSRTQEAMEFGLERIRNRFNLNCRWDDLGGLEIRDKVISYGLSSYGYDVRIANKFKIFTNINSTVVDPKNFSDKSFVDFEGDCCIIPPNSFVLASSLEYMRMPKDVTGLVLAKSTYARTGMSCLATPLEAGWEGHITLEYANTTPLPMKLYANEGAAQILFFKGSIPCEVSYADRGGKYQKQVGITLPKA